MSEGKTNIGLWIAIGVGGLAFVGVVLLVLGGLFFVRTSVSPPMVTYSSTSVPAPVAIEAPVAIGATLAVDLPYATEQEMLDAIAQLDSKDVAEIPAALGIETIGPPVVDGTVELRITKPTAGTLTITLEGGTVTNTKFIKSTE